MLFFKILKNLETYFYATKWLRDYVVYYAQKVESLQQREINFLKKELVKEKLRKIFNLKITVNNSTQVKINVYNQLQSDFSKTRWLIHFSKIRQLYVDVNVFRKEFDVMIYHRKKDENFKNSFFKRKIKFIFFLSKILFSAEIRYWSTKLEMT
jgi:hypothetical protein